MAATKISGEYRVPPGPEWMHNAVFYQIYPQTFYDSNGEKFTVSVPAQCYAV